MFRCLTAGFICLMFPLLLQAQTNEFVIFNEANTLAFAGTGNAFKCIGVGDSVFFAGTQYKGLYKYDTAIKVWYKSNQLTNVFINDIKTDKRKGVWIAQSGTSGSSGGGSNIAGGINYFPEEFDVNMQFYSVPGTTTGGGLISRNMRSVYVDTFYQPTNNADTFPRVWGVAATYLTSGNTSAGGISIGVNPTPNYFSNRKKGLQVIPYALPQGTPSCDAVGGDKDEIWVSVRQNFGLSQILRYHPSRSLQDGAFLGSYDSTKIKGGIFPVGFRAQAIFFDSEGKRWLGLQNGGIRVLEKTTWSIVNMPSILPSGTQVNNNAITEDDQGNVYFGTSNGLLVYDGAGEVTDVNRYKRLTTADGLPSNNITGMAYDKAKGRMLLTTDAGIVFWTVKNKIDVTLQWDYSFPKRVGKPKGVVADGVSRVYLRIKNGDTTLPSIVSVNISLHDYQQADSSTRGRFKAATVLNQYSEEASTGTVTDLTLNTPIRPKEFWAWYVAPTDYSRDSLGPDASTSVRTDKIRVIVSYQNNTKDTLIYDRMRVVRPPLLMVHGLASGPPTWYEFRNNDSIFFKDSPKFKYVNMLTMNGRALFLKNAQLLMSGDVAIDTALNRTNTLQGNLEQIRDMGYAANQVDYVCHSMGGIMIRHAIDRFGYKFIAGAGSGRRYLNYGKGFTHKIIFVNSPHNSSILGDGVDEFIPQAPEWVNNIMRLGYLADPQRQMPYDFIQPISPNNPLTTKFKASDAVNNLQVTDARGGVNLAETRAKFHMITGNINLLSAYTTTLLAELDPTIEYVNNILKCMLNAPYVPSTIKNGVLRPMLVLGNTARVLTFFEWYSRNLGYPDYLAESDGIVPLASEHARIPLPGAKPYISMFNNSPGSSYDASHITILKRKDVGQRVENLLNSKLYSNLFADVVPANTDPEPNPVLQPRNAGARPASTLATDITFYDTTRIRIDAPAAGIGVFADSTIQIKYRVKDTTNLFYTNVLFQYLDTFSITRTKLQQSIPIKVVPNLPGLQKVWAVAAYLRPDNGMTYYIDSFSVKVNNNAPLQGFRVKEDPVTVNGGENYYPPYEVKYNGNWYSLPSTESSVTVQFDPVGIVKRVDSLRAFQAVREGFTSAIFAYNGFSDTVLMKAVMPYDSLCVNRSVTSGSFKNPAIWSKGVVPDVCDSVVILHTVALDTSIQVKSINIQPAGILNLTSANITAQLGVNTWGTSILDNYGSFQVSNGQLNIQGRVQLHTGSRFNMSGGVLKIDGNAVQKEISVPDGVALFQAESSMASFSFSGGTLQIVDPPLGINSQTLDCGYDFGAASTLILGLNTSTTISNNPDGFGGLKFPARIGKLIIDAGTRSGNRVFINKKALAVKGTVEVRTGSGVVLQAPLTLTQ